jgi:hypothetical protein
VQKRRGKSTCQCPWLNLEETQHLSQLPARCGFWSTEDFTKQQLFLCNSRKQATCFPVALHKLVDRLMQTSIRSAGHRWRRGPSAWPLALKLFWSKQRPFANLRQLWGVRDRLEIEHWSISICLGNWRTAGPIAVAVPSSDGNAVWSNSRCWTDPNPLYTYSSCLATDCFPCTSQVHPVPLASHSTPAAVR